MRLAAALALALVLPGKARAQVAALAVGSAAPAFTAQSLDGAAHSLSDYSGRVVVLDFWASWSGAARQTAAARAEMGRRLGPNVLVLGVDVGEDASRAASFLASLPEGGLGETALVDADKSVFAAYRGASLPLAVVIGRDGTLLAVASGWGPQAQAQVENAVQAALADGGGN